MKKKKTLCLLKGFLFMFLWTITIGVFAQNITVQGTVTDEDGMTVIGATVVVQGSPEIGTVTDIDGNYTLNNVPSDASLQFSYVGMTSQIIPVNGRKTIDVVMFSDTELLDEVVVVGYGTQKKENLTGAVSQVSGDVLENRPISNIGQGLQGVIPNLNVNMNSGAPGQGASFNIRGTTSLNEGSPLVLVDNVQMDPNLVNPDDIASISVLKDAASAAIYGARAAFGVILITTKDGKKDQKPKISLSANTYWQNPATRVQNVNSLEYLEMKDLAYQNGGGSGHYYHQSVYDYAEKYFNGTYDSPVFFDKSIDPNKYQYNANTDWFKELYKTSFSQMYNMNITGGSDNTVYYMSLGLNDVGGLLRAADDDYKRINANINVSTDVTDWLNVSGKILNTYTKEKHPSGGTTAMNPTAYSGLSSYSGMMKNDLSPLMPVRHPDGNFAGQGSYTNPIAIQTQGGNNIYKQSDLWMTGALRLTPFEGFVFNFDYTHNIYNRGSKEHVQSFLDYTAVPGTEGYYPWTNPSSVTNTSNEDYYSALNAFAEYTKSLQDNTHNFKIMVGYNQEEKKNKYFWAGRQDLIDNTNPAMNLATGEKGLGYSETHWGISGIFARLNYNYKQRYLLELNGRYDGSSRFAKGDRYAFFPSLSAAWRISEESFFKNAKQLFDDLKIRASYGSLGNQLISQLGNFPYLPVYGVNTRYPMILGGSRPVAVTPPGLVSAGFTWETVEQLDLGYDFVMLNNRLNMSFDWYRRDTKDMLTSGQPLPAVLGTSVPTANAADLKTTGWEMSIGWNDRLSNGLNYWVKGALSDYQAEITKFSNPTGSIGSYYVGRKMGEIWGFRSDGLFQTKDEVESAPSQTEIWGGDWGPGDVRFEDLDGDGKITRGQNTLENPGDRTIIGNSTPRYSFGVTVGLEYKGVDFEMFWQGVGKRDFMPGGSPFWGFTSQWDTPFKEALDYWTEDNTDAYFPRPNWSNSGNRQTSDRYLQDASYMRLKNLTIGYSLPTNILQKIHVNKLRVFVTGENLFTFTSLIKSFDPETINNMVYPIQKKYSVGLNLTF